MMTLIVLKVIGIYIEVGAACELIYLIKNWDNLESQTWKRYFINMAATIFMWPKTLYGWIKTRKIKEQ